MLTNLFDFEIVYIKSLLKIVLNLGTCFSISTVSFHTSLVQLVNCFTAKF